MITLDSVSLRTATGYLFRNITWAAEEYSLSVIIGPNGAGKSTFLRVISGLTAPSGGVRSVRRRALTIAAQWQTSCGLFPRLTVLENLEYFIALSTRSYRDTKSRIEQAVEEFALRPLLEQEVQLTSTGQRQRINLAIAFHSGAQVIILDEPTLSLDDDHCSQLLHIIDAAVRGGKNVICATHDKRIMELEYARVLDLGGEK